MKVMISQPMSGKTQEEIKAVRKKAIKKIEADGDVFVNSYFPEYYASGVKNKPLAYLAQSISVMAQCDAVYFVDGWKDARGCRIEFEIAKEYNLNRFDETEHIQKEYEKTQAFFEYEKEGEDELAYIDHFDNLKNLLRKKKEGNIDADNEV